MENQSIPYIYIYIYIYIERERERERERKNAFVNLNHQENQQKFDHEFSLDKIF
jgi:hypothetical protein